MLCRTSKVQFCTALGALLNIEVLNKQEGSARCRKEMQAHSRVSRLGSSASLEMLSCWLCCCCQGFLSRPVAGKSGPHHECCKLSAAKIVKMVADPPAAAMSHATASNHLRARHYYTQSPAREELVIRCADQLFFGPSAHTMSCRQQSSWQDLAWHAWQTQQMTPAPQRNAKPATCRHLISLQLRVETISQGLGLWLLDVQPVRTILSKWLLRGFWLWGAFWIEAQGL